MDILQLTNHLLADAIACWVVEMTVWGLERHLPFKVIPFEDRLKLYAAFLIGRVMWWW